MSWDGKIIIDMHEACTMYNMYNTILILPHTYVIRIVYTLLKVNNL